jgi:hypothetical protein
MASERHGQGVSSCASERPSEKSRTARETTVSPTTWHEQTAAHLMERIREIFEWTRGTYGIRGSMRN